MQVGYEFYVDSYGGTNFSERDWKRISQKAYQRLKHFTFGNLPDNWEGEPWENQAKCAVCEMAEFLLLQEKRQGKTSESTDGYSVSYETDQEQDGKLYEIAYVYLGHTGMMDFGVDAGC